MCVNSLFILFEFDLTLPLPPHLNYITGYLMALQAMRPLLNSSVIPM